MTRAANTLPASLPPRGLSRVQGAEYFGVGTTKFDEMVKDGRISKPKRVDGRNIWDRLALDADFAALPSDEEGAPTWSLGVHPVGEMPVSLHVFLLGPPEEGSGRCRRVCPEPATVDQADLDWEKIRLEIDRQRIVLIFQAESRGIRLAETWIDGEDRPFVSVDG